MMGGRLPTLGTFPRRLTHLQPGLAPPHHPHDPTYGAGRAMLGTPTSGRLYVLTICMFVITYKIKRCFRV